MIRDNETGQPFAGWLDERPLNGHLPPIDYVYNQCQSRGYSPERTIDILLSIYHKQRMIRGGFLEDVPLVMGFIGPAGAGKSCGAAGVAIYDYLLAGMGVVSNMMISVTVKYRGASKTFESTDLDKIGVMNYRDITKMYRNVVLFMDEFNLEFGDVRTSMSKVNRAIAAMLQERRKRNVNILYTVQDESWVDKRVAFATDMMITCKDAAYDVGFPKKGQLGRKSHWRLHDMSGRITGEPMIDEDGDRRKTRYVLPYFEGEFNNRPFWNCYDSWLLQGLESDDPEQDPINICDTEALRRKKDRYKVGRELAADLISRGVMQIRLSDLWEAIGADISMKTTIGRDFKAIGIKKEGNRAESYYVISE